MPYAKRKNSDGTWRVVNEESGDVKWREISCTEPDTEMTLKQRFFAPKPYDKWPIDNGPTLDIHAIKRAAIGGQRGI